MAHPTQLNPTEQDALVKQIGLALLRAAPQDWAQIVIDYRAVGRHQESMGRVTTEGGEARPWRISGDIATLFAKLRAGMYREGRGTWFNARYQLDRPTSYNLEYDRDEPSWDAPPPPQAYSDELRTFPRDEENVPDWLMRRLAGVGPERPGPHFRIARAFDGMGQSGRPVVNRPPVDEADREDLLHYLDNAPVVVPGRGYDVDRLDAEAHQSVPVAFHSDGTWIWPASINYYLRKYRVPPEADLVEHVRQLGFAVPEVDEPTMAAAAAFLDRAPRQTPPPPPPAAATQAMPARPPARPAGPGPGRPPAAALPSQGGPGPTLNQLTAKLAEYGVPESVVRIGPPVENTWTLERSEDSWRVGFFQRGEFVAPAKFEDVADASAFLLGKVLMDTGWQRPAQPPTPPPPPTPPRVQQFQPEERFQPVAEEDTVVDEPEPEPFRPIERFAPRADEEQDATVQANANEPGGPDLFAPTSGRGAAVASQFAATALTGDTQPATEERPAADANHFADSNEEPFQSESSGHVAEEQLATSPHEPFPPAPVGHATDEPATTTAQADHFAHGTDESLTATAQANHFTDGTEEPFRPESAGHSTDERLATAAQADHSAHGTDEPFRPESLGHTTDDRPASSHHESFTSAPTDRATGEPLATATGADHSAHSTDDPFPLENFGRATSDESRHPDDLDRTTDQPPSATGDERLPAEATPEPFQPDSFDRTPDGSLATTSRNSPADQFTGAEATQAEQHTGTGEPFHPDSFNRPADQPFANQSLPADQFTSANTTQAEQHTGTGEPFHPDNFDRPADQPFTTTSPNPPADAEPAPAEQHTSSSEPFATTDQSLPADRFTSADAPQAEQHTGTREPFQPDTFNRPANQPFTTTDQNPATHFTDADATQAGTREPLHPDTFDQPANQPFTTTDQNPANHFTDANATQAEQHTSSGEAFQPNSFDGSADQPFATTGGRAAHADRFADSADEQFSPDSRADATYSHSADEPPTGLGDHARPADEPFQPASFHRADDQATPDESHPADQPGANDEPAPTGLGDDAPRHFDSARAHGEDRFLSTDPDDEPFQAQERFRPEERFQPKFDAEPELLTHREEPRDELESTQLHNPFDDGEDAHDEPDVAIDAPPSQPRRAELPRRDDQSDVDTGADDLSGAGLFTPTVPVDPTAPRPATRPMPRRAQQEPAELFTPAAPVNGRSVDEPAEPVEPPAATPEPRPAPKPAGGPPWPIKPLDGEPPLTLFRGKEMRELPTGTELDRYGEPDGNLTYTVSTPFEQRSLVPDWVNRPYHVYRVVRPVEVLSGVAIPWFDQPGGGTAFMLPESVEELLHAGVLVEVADAKPPQ